MKKYSMLIAIWVGLLLMVVLGSVSVLSDGGGTQDANYYSVGIAEKLEGKVIMEGGNKPEPVLLKQGGLIENYSTVKTKENASLLIVLGPELALGKEYRSTIEFNGDTEVSCNVYVPYYGNTDIWWKNESHWIDNDIAYNFNIKSGSLKTYLHSNIFEYVKEYKYQYHSYTIVPSTASKGDIEFEVKVVKNAQFGKDFEITDVYSLQILAKLKLAEMGVNSVEELSEEQKEEYDYFMESYDMMVQFQQFDVLVLTVKSGNVKVIFGLDVIEIGAGETRKFAEVANNPSY